jgi:hypothetical protein
MRLPERLVHLFPYPTPQIERHLPPAASPVWDMEGGRQNVHNVHRFTRSIVFEWLDSDWTVGKPVVVKHLDYAPAELVEPVYRCANILQEHFGGKIVKLMLAELAPGGHVAVHRDAPPSLTEVHRCHVPVLTNPDVIFFIEKVPHYLEPGNAYEFDNTRFHSVWNRSATRRVHLLCDIMPPELVS